MINLPIDTKSLYYNIYNDNLNGHTCTVATPIKQGRSVRSELSDIYKIPKQLNQKEIDNLADVFSKNSKSITRTTNVFIFDKIKVNNLVVNTKHCYCMFIKEEIDPSKVQYGRVQLHYPISLKIEQYNVNNKAVLNEISHMFHDFAFIIESFDYDLETGFLNFHLLIVGYHDIPYSKVFINNKGAGSKLNSNIKNYIDSYDVEINGLRKKYGDNVDANNFGEEMDVAMQVAKRLVKEKIETNGAKNVRDISVLYPYSLFDLQYELEGLIYYAIIYPTFSNVPYFNLSYFQSIFIDTISTAHVFIVNNVGEEDKIKISEFNRNDFDLFDIQANSFRYVLK